jgi:hypothetical protein
MMEFLSTVVFDSCYHGFKASTGLCSRYAEEFWCRGVRIEIVAGRFHDIWRCESVVLRKQLFLRWLHRNLMLVSSG